MTETTEAPFVSRRRPEGIEVRPMGWWGVALLGAVLATTYGALYFTYVYIRVGTELWPPEGVMPPALGLAAWSALALAVSVAPARVALAAELRRNLPLYRLAILAMIALAVGHFALVLVDWGQVPFRHDEHAYGSLYFVLPGIHFTILGIGVIMAIALLLLSFHEVATAMLHIGMRSLALYWSVAALGGVLLLGVIYLLPHLWPIAHSPAGAGP